MRSSVLSLLTTAFVVSAVLFEAESGTTTGVLAIESASPGFTGTGYVAGWDDEADTLTVSISAPAAGSYDIGIVYSAQFGNKYTTFSVNGGATTDVALTNVTTSAWTSAAAGSYNLIAGINTVKLVSFWGYYYIDAISVIPTPEKAVKVVDVTNGAKAEAEDGIFNGVLAATSVAGYSGTGYVESFDNATDSLTLTLYSAKQSLYDLVVRYDAPYGGKQTIMVLNGGTSSSIAFEDMTGATIRWANVSGGQILLNAGNNTIQFQSNWGWYLIDYISVTPAPAPPPHQVSTSLVAPSPLPIVRALYNKLLSKYGSGQIFSGQSEVRGVNWLEANVGKTPAIIGLDLMDYSPSRIEYGVGASTAIEEAIAWDARNGIVSIQWHWNAPTDLINNDTVKWWSGFYAYATTFNLTAALNPSSPNYALLLRDMDAIATHLLRLQAANVPVLWRPLHEADGTWFWWGAYGPESFKALYRLMYTRFTTVHKLRNLIWVGNTVTPSWYPGDDVIDIVGYDSYPPIGDHGPISVQYQQLLSFVGDKKMVALPEVGAIPDPDILKLYHADWSYFVTWNGDFIESDTYNNLAFKKKVYEDPTVLKLSDLGSWKGSATSTTTKTSSTTFTTSKVSTTTV
ncbi:glycosyl hydrolase family 26-domain-containing protein [Halenospora varia]|nr:glycosyl hydrolase family 26-domain-containing protein [Halenospora varia]